MKSNLEYGKLSNKFRVEQLKLFYLQKYLDYQVINYIVYYFH